MPKQLTFLVIALGIFFPESSYPVLRRHQQDWEMQNYMQNIQDEIASNKHEINNHESEIRTLDEKLSIIENILESLSLELSEGSRMQNERLRGSETAFDEKTKTTLQELSLLRQHANETTQTLGNYQKKIAQMEETNKIQNQNIEKLQEALQILAEALQVKLPSVSHSTAISYVVKPGDSLDKISKEYGISIKEIKEINHLKSDTIFAGQQLKISPKK